MLILTLGLLLAAEPAPPPELKLAAPGLTTTGLSPAFAAPLTDHLAKSFIGIRVVTPTDIAALIGLERQKQLMGCSDDSAACMAELGDALGVQGLLVGELIQLGKSIQINLRIVDPGTGQKLATASARIRSQEAVFEALTRAGGHLREQFLHAMKRGPPPGPPPVYPQTVSDNGKGTRRFFLIPLALGVGALGASLGCYVLSEQAWSKLTSGPVGSVTVPMALATASDGRTFQTAAAVLLTVGLAIGVGGGGSVLLFGSPADPDEPSASLAPSLGGAQITGTF